MCEASYQDAACCLFAAGKGVAGDDARKDLAGSQQSSTPPLAYGLSKNGKKLIIVWGLIYNNK